MIYISVDHVFIRCLVLGFPDLAEGKIDSWQHGSGGLGHLMFPIGIGAACHEKKSAVVQRNLNRRYMFECLMAQTKQTGFTKGHRSDVHIFVAGCSFIAVPSDTVSAVPVEIKEHRVKTDLRLIFNPLPDLQQFFRPVGI